MTPPLAGQALEETRLEAGGHVKGVVIAVVCDNRDDSGLGRVKIGYPWFSDGGESYWARIAMPMAGNKRGTWFLPEIGDEVLVAFERGDLRFPYVIGSLWSGQEPPPVTNDRNNDIREIRTRKDHVLQFNDGSRGLILLQLNDGKKIAIDDDGLEVDDGKGNSVVIKSAQGSVTVKASTSITLEAPQVTIKASAKADVTATGNLTLSGALVRIN